MESDLAALGGILRKLGHDCRHWGFEVEQPAFKQNHGHGGGGRDFRKGSQVENTRRGCGGGIGGIGEAAKGSAGDQFSTLRDGDRGRREGSFRNGAPQHVKGLNKGGFLLLVRRHRKSGGGVGGSVQRQCAFIQGWPRLDVRFIAKFRVGVKPSACGRNGTPLTGVP